MISALLLSFALAQEPTPAAADASTEAPVVIEAPAPAPAPAAGAIVVDEPKAGAASANEVKLPLPEVVPPKTDAEAVAHAEQAFDAILAGEIGVAITLIAGIFLYLSKKWKKAPPAE